LGQFGQLHYTKGATFLRTIESAVGRDRWDAYLRSYFDRHAFQPQTTAGFLADLRSELIKGDAGLEAQLQLERWAYQPGLPENAVHIHSAALARIDADVASFQAGAPLSEFRSRAWTTQEWLRFLTKLPRKLTLGRMESLDRELSVFASNNALIGSAWLDLVIANHYEPGQPSLEKYLRGVGRIDLILPLYRDLVSQGEWGQQFAKRIYAETRSTYHPIAVALIDKALASAPQTAAPAQRVRRRSHGGQNLSVFRSAFGHQRQQDTALARMTVLQRDPRGMESCRLRKQNVRDIGLWIAVVERK
jgi:hypothetical protein